MNACTCRPPRWAPLLLLGALLALTACGGGAEAARDDEVTFTEGGETESDVPPPNEPANDTEVPLVVGEDACETDADCVPAGCCHPTACVATANAPDCSDVMCTTDCQFGTLDCGGACLCHEGRCAARLSAAPQPQVQ